MADDEILAILVKFSDYLQIGDIFQNGFRLVGWIIVDALIWFVDTITGNFSEVLGILNFRNSTWAKTTLDMLEPIQHLLLGFAILAVGIILYLGKNSEMRNIPLNVFLIICTLAMLPNLLTQGVRLTEAIGQDFSENQGGLGFQTFKNNTVDVYELGAKGWTTDQLEERNYLEDLKFFDINERIDDAKKVDPDGILNYEARNKINGKGYEVKKIKAGDGLLDSLVKSFVAPTYYRWRVFWIPVLITLLALAGATGLFVIRAGRLGFEITFNYIWANITAFVHIRDLRKFKQAIFEIFVGLITLASMFVLFYLYIGFNTYVSNGSESMIIKALLYVGGAWLLFDGPAIIQKQVGVDAGLSTAGGVLAGFGAGKAFDGMKDLAKTGSNVAAGGVGGILGALKESKASSGGNDKKSDSDDKGLFGGKDGSNDSDNDSENSDGTGGENSGINDQLDKQKDGTDSTDSNEPSGETSSGADSDTKGIGDGESDSSSDSSSDTEEPSSNTDSVNDGLGETDTPTEQPQTSTLSGMTEANEQQPSDSDSGKTNAEQSTNSEGSKEKSEPPKKPTKPKHPFVDFAKTELSTPKSMKNNKGTIGDLHESGSKGHALGKDLVRYTQERKQYIKDKDTFNSYKKAQKKSKKEGDKD